MKKRTIFTLTLLVLFSAALAQHPYKVLFYNLENLFDTIDDPTTRDEEFLPAEAKRWNSAKYERKMSNIERVLFDVAAVDRIFPVVIGVCEIENRSVLEELVATPRLAPADYRIVHYDSPDARGVDVAFLYRPALFRLSGSRAVRAEVPGMPSLRTRDILTMWGKIEGEEFYFMVAHWPSRLGGREASEPRRMAIGEQMHRLADSVLKHRPATRIVAMGDFNDDPTDRSVTEGLRAQGDLRRLAGGEFYNPFASMFRAGYGTLAYGDRWNLFDQIVVSPNLTGEGKGFRLLHPAGSRFYGAIFSQPYMIQREGPFRGYPLRTYVGNDFQGGFSDHFPVYIYFATMNL